MARPLRIEYIGALYHVTSRGNAKGSIFIDDGDRDKFLKILSSVVKKHEWLCHGYCLMDNHYHLLIETPKANLSKGMRQLNGVYTQTFNRIHDRVGHIFQGRYKAILVEKDGYLLELCRYIVLNPVRAGIVKEPEDWRWSSYLSTAGIEGVPEYLTVDWILGQFGGICKEAQEGYRAFVRAGFVEGSPWKNLRGQILLGSEGFTEKFRELLSKREKTKEIPKAQRYIGRQNIDEILNKEGMKDREIRNRQIYEAIVLYGYTQKEVAEYLGLHYTTISKALREVELKN